MDLYSSNQPTIMINTYGESVLTKREEDVVSHLLKGKSNVQIAAGLNISLNTVKTHLKHVFSKMEVRSRQEL